MERDFLTGLNNEIRERSYGPRQPDATGLLSDELPLHPPHGAPEPWDAGVERVHLHPVATPPPSPYAQSREEKLKAIDDFCFCLTSIVEEEYGDWMRRANIYLLDLTEALHGEGRKVQKLLYEIQMIIQLLPDFRIAETCRSVVKIAMRIREAMGAPSEIDWHRYNLAATTQTETLPVPPYSLRLDDPIKPAIEPYLDGEGNQSSINGELRGFRL